MTGLAQSPPGSPLREPGLVFPGDGPDQATALADLDGRHPCFSKSKLAHFRSGRLHLPVSPTCNILCGFCKRDFNGTSQRPGVARRLIRPEAAVAMVERALELCPEISVVGIAGPGDTLASDHALETFALLHRRFPNLINCLSTNGLLLPQKAQRLVEAGLKTVTVTVNAVDPLIGARLNAGIHLDGKWIMGPEGAEILIKNQLAGIRFLTGRGVVVKINAVLVPGINADHIEEIARRTHEAGASLINIIPLIPQHKLSSVLPPTAAELEQAQKDAAQHLSVFSHCHRCRADACGIPGKSDFSSALYGEQAVLSQPATFSHG